MDQGPSYHPRSVGGSLHGRHTSTRRVRDILRASIADGLSFSRDGLTEDFLVEELGASRNSVREALQLLAEEGLVDRKRRVGTSISGSIVSVPVSDMVSSRIDGELGIRWIEQRTVPSNRFIREKLQTDAAHVGMIEYLFVLAGQPVGVRSLYFAAGHEILETPIAKSTPDAFAWSFGEELGRVETVLEAVNCDAKTARLLHVSDGTALLVRQDVFYGVSGVPRELAFTHYRPDKISLTHDTEYAARPSAPGTSSVEAS
jgi:GntR family transcriptional regulator